MKGNRQAARLALAIIGAGLIGWSSTAVLAYDGLKCKEPGICWEPKPGYPAKIAGSKYDPKHNPMELAKQQDSIKAMEERNRKRVEHFKKTGQWVYDVSKIPAT
jgi:methanol dehydrogenase (cytochrome c) subunit 2